MFNRVNAFLEAIDKKTEAMADAADEEDIVRALQRQQQQQEQQQQRLRSSVPSSGASSVHHGGTNTPHLTFVDGRSSTGAVGAGGGTPFPLRGRSTATGSTVGGGGGGGPSPASPALTASTASLRTSAAPQGVTTTTAADAYANVPLVPLSLPTKLPSFHPSPAEGGTSPRNNRHHDDISSTPAAAAAAVAAAGPSSSPSVFSYDSTTERLQQRCATLEADKARWQQAAATHKAQCSDARDALWKAEQEVRACRAAQRDAERTLAAYKETSQRLLETAQQELRHAQAAHGGKDEATNAQQEAVAQSLELRQRLELLQAEHAALQLEVDRLQQEAAKASAEMQQGQQSCRAAQAQVDTLRLEVLAAQESLEGEVAAHADTKRALRDLQTEQQQQQQQRLAASAVAAMSNDAADPPGNGDDGVDVAQLQRALREARQQQQRLMLQLSNKQTVLDSAEREVADLKARFNALARQFDDAQVEVAAGFRASGGPASAYGDSAGNSSNNNPGGGGVGGSRIRAGGGSASHDKAGPSSLGGSGNPSDTLRRNPAMVRLVRQYGTAGRAVVSVLAAVDAAALRLGRMLTQTKWVWRVVLMGYIALLQLWVVLLVLANMASEEREEGITFIAMNASVPL